jgi:uncharacterized protein
MAVLAIGGLAFEWDDDKEDSNIRKHGVSFLEAVTVFRDRVGILKPDIAHSTDED